MKRRRLKDKVLPRRARRFTYAWLSEQPNFTLIYAALETAQRNFLGYSMHSGNGGKLAPCRHHADALQRRYADILRHLKAMLRT